MGCYARTFVLNANFAGPPSRPGAFPPMMEPMTPDPTHPATVRVLEEAEATRGWTYRIEVARGEGVTTTHRVTLGWRDHDYWCGGASAPSRVIQRVLEYVLAHREESLPEAFDAARARRWFPHIDEELRHAA